MIQKIQQAIVKAVSGHETFYRQYDEFRIRLTRWTVNKRPYIHLSVLVCFGNPGVTDNGESQLVMKSISDALQTEFPETKFEWQGGFSGGNPRGWDMWLSLDIGTLADRLSFEEDEVLFLHQSERVKE